MVRSLGRATGLEKRKQVSIKDRLHCSHICLEDQLNLTKREKTNNKKNCIESEAGRIGKYWVSVGGKRTGIRVNLTPDRVFLTTE